MTVENEDFVKTKRLPEQMSNIPDRMTLKARYYIKSHVATEALVPDDIVPDLIKVRNIRFVTSSREGFFDWLCLFLGVSDSPAAVELVGGGCPTHSARLSALPTR